jgi:hypothetical protein
MRERCGVLFGDITCEIVNNILGSKYELMVRSLKKIS